MAHIRKSIPRCSDELIERFRKMSAATVHEVMGRRGALDCAIKPVAGGMKACGRAITVAGHPADNIMLIKAVSMARENDVVVMNCGSIVHAGGFGEVLATECIARKMGGIVVSGSVRDSAALARLGPWAISSTTSSLVRSSSSTTGGANGARCGVTSCR